MIDRLADYLRKVERRGIKLAPQTQTIKTESEEMVKFSELVNTGNRIIEGIRENTQALIDTRKALYNAFGGKEDSLKADYKRISEVIETYRREGKNVADNMKSVSEQHKSKIKEIAIDKGVADYGQDEIRVVANLNGAYIKNFEAVCADSVTEQDEIKKVLQLKLIRNVENIKGETISDEEKQAYLENDNKFQELLENRLTQGKAHVSLKNKLRDLEERNEEIKKLENVSHL